jgi:hypothetical protein
VSIDVLVIEPGQWKARRETVEPDLRTFQRLVGGSIEALSLTDEVSAYINEEGKLVDLPRNEAGDRLVKHALSTVGRTMIPGDYVAGPLVLMGQPDDEGEDTGVPESVVELLKAAKVTIGSGPAVEVTVPDPVPVERYGREGRGLITKLPTSIPSVFLHVSTSHWKDRKRFSSFVLGVRHLPRDGVFSSELSAPMSGKTIGAVPVARFSQKDLAAAHETALDVVRLALEVDPDAFTDVLMATPERD